MPDILCLGEALIDFMPLESGKKLIEVDAFKKVAGGAPANVAVGVARLDRSAAFIGRVGDDDFGRYLEQIFIENQVDVSQIQFDSQARTGLAFVSLPTPNTREFLFYRNPSADMMLDSKQFDLQFLRSGKVFHFGSITLVSQPSRSATLKAAGTAKQGGLVISYDPNLRPALWPDLKSARQQIIKPLGLADVVKVNDEELAFLTGEKDHKLAMEQIREYGPRLVILTLGQYGSYYLSDSGYGKVETFQLDTVDATGCGDSFVAGLLCGILDYGLGSLALDQALLEKVLKFSSAAAAITSTRKGIIDALPYRKAVNHFLKIDS